MKKSGLIYKKVTSSQQFNLSHKNLINEERKIQSGQNIPIKTNTVKYIETPKKCVRFRARVAVLFYNRKDGEVMAAGCKHIDKKEIILLKKKIDNHFKN